VVRGLATLVVVAAAVPMAACGSGARRSAEPSSTVPEAVVAIEGLALGRSENTDLFATTDGTLVVVDGTALDPTGRRRLTVWSGDPNGLRPHRLAGPPLVFVSAFAQHDGIVVTGTRCPHFVPEEPEEPSSADICGTNREVEVRYHLGLDDGTWRRMAPPPPQQRDPDDLQVVESCPIGPGDRHLVLRQPSSATTVYGPNPAAGSDLVAYKVTVEQGNRSASPVVPPSPFEIQTDYARGCLPGRGALFQVDDAPQLALLTVDDAGELAWDAIPDPPAGSLLSDGSALTAWAGVEGDHVKGLVFDGEQWLILGISKGVVHLRAAYLDHKLIYQYSSGAETALGVM